MTDDTAALQAKIDAAQGTLVVPPGTYMIDATFGSDGFAAGGLRLKSNLSLVLDGVTLQVIPNRSDHYTVLTVKGCSNVTISGGKIVGDRVSREGVWVTPPGMFGFGIAVWNSTEVRILGTQISELWGDAVTIIGSSWVTVDKVVSRHNRRQGMSVISGKGLRFTNCTFLDNAMSGLDLECDLASETISNVLVQYCSFSGQGGPAHIGVGSPVGSYKGIAIKDCQFNLKMQPIFVHDQAGNLGTPWWAFVLNRVFYEGLKVPTYRFVGYPQTWSD